MNSITGTPNPAVLPTAYHGYGKASRELPPILKLPKEVLNLIVEELVKQNNLTSLIPLRFVCKHIANLPAVQKTTNATQINVRIQDISQPSIPLVAWYHDCLHCPLTEYLSAAATRSGMLDLLQWLREKECPWDALTCFAAAKGGHLEVLKWARTNGCPWDADICSAAASADHLEVLQWARTNGCEWNVATCAYAAREGHLEVLQWARANGCPWGAIYLRVCGKRWPH